MDIKEIAGKELGGEDVSELVKDFTDEQTKEYNKTFLSLSKEAKSKDLAEVVALRKAKADLKQKTDDLSSDQAKQFHEKARGEQLVKARSKFLADFGLTEDTAKSLDEEFKSVDSGKIDADLIYGDFKKAYAKANADTLIEAQRANKILEKNAVDYNASSAGSSNSGGGSSEGKKYSNEAYEAVKAARVQGIPLSLDDAEKGLMFGKGTKGWKVI